MQNIYLGGNMAGLEYSECIGWRIKFKNRLEKIKDSNGIQLYHVISPVRGKDFLRGKVLTATDDDSDKSWSREVYRRDKWDVLRSQIAVFNFLLADKANSPSIGSIFELAWASDHHIFSIVILNSNSIVDHVFVRESASVIVKTEEEALYLLENVLNA